LATAGYTLIDLFGDGFCCLAWMLFVLSFMIWVCLGCRFVCLWFVVWGCWGCWDCGLRFCGLFPWFVVVNWGCWAWQDCGLRFCGLFLWSVLCRFVRFAVVRPCTEA